MHELVLVDEDRLCHFDDFERNDQRDRDHGVDEDEVGAEDERSVSTDCVAGPRDVIVRVFVVANENTVQNGYDYAEDNLQQQDKAQDVVDFFFNLRHFGNLSARIHHDLGIAASVDDQPKDPLGVHEFGSSIQELLVLTEVDTLGANLHSRVKLMQFLTGNDALKLSLKFSDTCHTLVHLRSGVCVSRFKILLAVQTGSLDEGRPSLRGRDQQKHISWEEIILFNFADVSH